MPMNHKSVFITIGFFDGMHRGHQAIIQALKQRAQKKGTSVVLTFLNHPLHIIQGHASIPLLMRRQDLFEMLRSTFQVDHIKIIPFTKAFSKKSPEDFIQWIRQQYGHLREIIVGENFRFGFQASGNLNTLKKLGKKCGFKVRGVPSVQLHHQVISSSKIRRLLSQGKVAQANAMLGHTYYLSGRVIPGRHRGRTWNIPTANLSIDSNPVLKDGVYVAKVLWKRKFYPAIMNLGMRPTFFRKNSSSRIAEVHIMDFDQNMYRQYLKVYLFHYLRNEKKFSNPSDLIQQIHHDIAAARQWNMQSVVKSL